MLPIDGPGSRTLVLTVSSPGPCSVTRLHLHPAPVILFSLVIMLIIVSGHDFVLDPSLVNNITAVELPSFARPEPTATAAVTTTFEFSEDPSSNEIEVEITTMSL